MKRSSTTFALTLSLLLAIFTTRVAPAAQTIKTIFETQKLLNPDGQTSESFGGSVSISGSVAVVGNIQDMQDGSFSGSASIYRFDGTSWNLEATVTGADEMASDQFGEAVAVSGNTAFIGAPFDKTAAFLGGAVYVFTFNGATWVQQAKLFASDAAADGLFGLSIALSGNTAVIGSSAEAAYVFTFNGTSWVQQAELMASDGTTSDDHFGKAVALSGTKALIGSNTHGVGGTAYIFSSNGTTWSQEAELTGLDTRAGDTFGSSVALSGNLALVGAPDRDTDRGAAYIFAFDGTNWNQQTKLKVSGAQKYDSFGSSVALSGTTAIVGAQHFLDPGKIYQFTLRRNVWTLRAQLVASDGNNGNTLGTSVGLSGNTVIGGASDDYYAAGIGAAYIFQLGN